MSHVQGLYCLYHVIAGGFTVGRVGGLGFGSRLTWTSRVFEALARVCLFSNLSIKETRESKRGIEVKLEVPTQRVERK